MGQAPAIDNEKAAALPEEQKKKLGDIQAVHRKESFIRQAALPAFMLLCYAGMWYWFRTRGGYRPVEIGMGSG